MSDTILVILADDASPPNQYMVIGKVSTRIHANSYTDVEVQHDMAYSKCWRIALTAGLFHPL